MEWKYWLLSSHAYAIINPEGLYKAVKNITNIGKLISYSKEHPDSLEDYGKATLLVIASFVLLGVLMRSCSRWYAKRCLHAGDEKARRGKHEVAVGLYSRAIEFHPKYAIAFHNRGLAEIALGHVEQAAKDFSRANELDATFPVLTHES